MYSKKSIVNKCLDTYNRNKTVRNREAFLKARKDYKCVCRKRKETFLKDFDNKHGQNGRGSKSEGLDITRRNCPLS